MLCSVVYVRKGALTCVKLGKGGVERNNTGGGVGQGGITEHGVSQLVWETQAPTVERAQGGAKLGCGRGAGHPGRTRNKGKVQKKV